MIRDRKAQAQFINFNSLSRNRNFDSDKTGKGIFHPADIDGILQFSAKTHPMSAKYNQAILVYEFKRQHAIMPIGQKILLQGLVDAIQKSGGLGLVCIARHSVENAEEDVDGGLAVVSEYYYDGHWRNCPPMSAIEFTDCFLIGAGLKKGGDHDGNNDR